MAGWPLVRPAMPTRLKATSRQRRQVAFYRFSNLKARLAYIVLPIFANANVGPCACGNACYYPLMTTTYTITSSSGAELGTYDATTPREALDEMAMDAGYCSHKEACDVTGASETSWTTDREAFRRHGYELLVLEASGT